MTRRKPTKSRLQNPPLQNPVQSPLESRVEPINDKLLQYIWYPVIALCWALYEWCRFLFDFGPQYVAATLVAAVILVTSIPLINRIRKSPHAASPGITGGKSVGQFLEQFRAHGYQIFHNVPGDPAKSEYFNIDHVLIGPGGVFTIQTKDERIPASGHRVIKSDRQNVLVNGIQPQSDPIKLALAQRCYLRNLLIESTGQALPVFPIVVYPGWYVQNKAPGSTVQVLNEKMMSHVLNASVAVLAEDQVHMAAYHISRHILSVTSQAA